MKPLAVGAAAVLCAVLGAVVLVPSVFAHSRPVRLDPPPGAVLQSAPAEVKGWFTAALRRDPNWNFIRVIDANGARADQGEPQLSADRKQMSVALRSGLADGRYLVQWRSFDDVDGAIFGDCYYFFVGQAAADAQVTANTRLDGGSACERIDVSARAGTPVPGVTPTAVTGAAPTATGGDAHNDGPDEVAGSNGNDAGSDGVPVWATAIGIAAGLAVGLVGGRFVLGK